MFPLAITQIENDSDRRFMENLFLTYQKKMFCAAWRWTQNKEDAEDLMNEAIIKLINYIPTMRTKTGFVLERYIVLTIDRIAIDKHRKKSTQPYVEVLLPDDDETFEKSSDSGKTPEQTYFELSGLQELVSVLGILPGQQGKILELKYVLDYTNDEIAKLLRLKDADSVRAYLSKARDNAKRILKERRRG